MRTHEQSRAHYSPLGASSRLELFIPVSPTSSLLLTSAFTLTATAAKAEKQKEQLRQIPKKLQNKWLTVFIDAATSNSGSSLRVGEAL